MSRRVLLAKQSSMQVHVGDRRYTSNDEMKEGGPEPESKKTNKDDQAAFGECYRGGGNGEWI